MAGLSTKKPRIASVAQLLRVDDLSGGIELRLSASLLKPNQARRLRNWSLEEPGALVTYPGWLAFSTTSLGSRRVQGANRIYLKNLTPFTLAADNGNVYKPSDAGVWGSSVLSSRDATNQHYFPYDRDIVADFDGTNVPKKSTDGTTWTGMGIAAPSAAPTASAVAGGSLIVANTYELSYSYEDDELVAESNESPTVQQATAGANLTVRLGVTASTDPQVDKIFVYLRNVTAGESTRRKYGTTFANTTGNIDITSPSAASAAPAPTDHNVPVSGLVSAIIWKNRWWAWIGNRLYFTQIFQNQSWPGLFYIDLPFEKGDNIAAVVAQGDTLVAFGQASKPFVIIGQTSLDFEVRPALGAQAGAFGPRAVEIIENGIVHATAEGVYIFDGSSDRLLSYNINPGWTDLVQHATASDLARIAITYHGFRKELRIAVTRLYPYSTAGEWVLDLNRTRTQEIPAWTSTDRTIGGYVVWTGNEPTLGNRGRIFSWSDTIAKLFEEATGTTANGADTVADYYGSTHATGGYVSVFTEGYLEYQPAAGMFAITPYVDGASQGSQNIAINTGLLPWGSASAPYGTSTRLWGAKGRAQTPFMCPMTAEGRTYALGATYTGQAQFKWFTYTQEMIPEGALSGI